MKNRIGRQIMKRAFIVLLAAVVLFSNVNVTAFAVPEGKNEGIIPEEEVVDESMSGNDLMIPSETEDENTSPEDENEGTVSENDISAEAESVSANSPAATSDVKIQGAGSLGRALLNAVPADVNSSDSGYKSSISEIVVSGTQAYVTYYTETPEDHTLVVGIYDESGVKQLAVGSIEVASGIKETTLTLEGSVPEYFIIKGHMIETDTLRPLCEPYESDDYTEKMQKFYAKTTEDFDEEKVVQFDENDNTNNFIVFSDAIKMISQDEEGTTNKLLSYNETNHIYIIENPDEKAIALKEGDILSYTGNDDALFLTEIVELEWNEDNTLVTIRGKEVDREDIFRFIKIGADNPKDLVAAPASYSVMGISDEEEEDPSADGELTERLTFHVGTDKFSTSINGSPEVEIDWKKLDALKELRDKGLSDEELVKQLDGIPEGVINDIQNLLEKGERLKEVADDNKDEADDDEGPVEAELGLDFLFCADAKAKICQDEEEGVDGVEFNIWYKTKVDGNLDIKGMIETPSLTVPIPLGTIPLQLLDAKFTTHFELEAELEFVMTAECEGAYTFDKVGLLGELNATKQTQDFQAHGEINGTVSLSVVLGLSAILLEPSKATDYMGCTKEQEGLINILADGDLLSISVTGKFGISLGIAYTNEDAYVDGMIHECWDLRYVPEGNMPGCLAVTIKPIIEFTLEACVFWFVSGEAEIDVAEMLPEVMNEVPFYYSFAFKVGGPGKCENRIKMESDQKIITVTDLKGNPVADANIYLWANGNQNIVTDATGNAVCYLREGAQNIYVEKDGVLYSEQVNIPDDLVDGYYVQILPLRIGGRFELNLGTRVKEIYDGGAAEVYAALTEDGSLYMWGTNKYGQLGIGNSTKTEDSPTTLPGGLVNVPIKVMDDVKEFHLSSDGHTCAAVTKENGGTLYMWGRNMYGRIANGDTSPNGYVNKPYKVEENVKYFSFINNHGSGEYNCALIKQNTNVFGDSWNQLYMWGYNSNHVIAEKDKNNGFFTEPKYMMQDVKEIYAVDDYCFAVCEDGTVRAWGNNARSALGDSWLNGAEWRIPGDEPRIFSKSLKKYSTGEKGEEWSVKYCFDSTSEAGAFVADDGKLYMWGNTYSGSFEQEDGTFKWEDLVEVKLDSALSVEQIYGKNGNWIALMSDGSIYNWRVYSYAAYNVTAYAHTEPVHMTQTEGKIKDIYISNIGASKDIGSTCAVITEDNKLYMWGNNAYYQLGMGDALNRTTPVAVLPEEEIRDFAFVGKACVAITKQDELYIWGDTDTSVSYDAIYATPIKWEGVAVDQIIPYYQSDGTNSTKAHFAVTEKNGNKIWSRYGSGAFIEQEMDAAVKDSLNYSNSTYCLDLTKTGNVYFRTNFENPEQKYLFGNYKFLTGNESAATAAMMDATEASLNVAVVPLLSEAESGEALEEQIETESVENPAEQTADFTDLLPDEIYNVYAVKERTEEDCLVADNLLYLDQFVSNADGTLSVTFEMRMEYENPVVFCVPFKQTDIADADVQIEEITADGHRHLPKATVTYKETELIEDRDYKIEDRSSVIEAGEYQMTIEGIGLYTGKKTVTYTVKEDPYKDILVEDIPEGGVEVIPEGLWIAGISEAGYSYTGKAIRPDFRVYDGYQLLVSGKDYTISYRNNVNANDASVSQFAPTIYITGKGNYTGRVTAQFVITPKALSNEDIVAEEIFTQANNKTQKKIPSVTWNGKKLLNKLDYTVEYPDFENLGDGVEPYKTPGDYKIRIKGIGNYSGEKIVDMHIVGNELISKAYVADIADQSYTGSAITPVLEITHGTNKLKPDMDYSVTYSNNIAIGTATAVINGKGNYSGTKTVTFEIVGTSIAKAVVSGIPASLVYTGESVTTESDAWEEKPVLNITVDKQEKTLVNGMDYEISYRTNINKGTAIITFTGINAYSGKISRTFRITPYDIEDDASEKMGVTLASDTVNYEKGGNRPKPTVMFGDTVLTENKDYTLRYENNSKVNDGSDASNMPTVIVMGKGNFSGSMKKTFTIIGADIADLEMTVEDKVFVNSSGIFESEPVITAANGQKLKKGKDYSDTITYKYKYDTVFEDGTIKTAGTVISKEDIVPSGTTIEVIAIGKGDYEGLIKSEYRIVEHDISKVKVDIEKQDYTGTKVTLDAEDITVKYGDEELVLGEDFEITGYEDNVDRGKAKVTIKGIGEYGGTKTVKFTIKSKLLEWWEGVLALLFG